MMRISEALRERLMRVAFDLRASGDELDAQAAKWILAHEQRERTEARKRQPKKVRVRLKQGGEAWLPHDVLKRAEREDQQDE